MPRLLSYLPELPDHLEDKATTEELHSLMTATSTDSFAAKLDAAVFRSAAPHPIDPMIPSPTPLSREPQTSALRPIPKMIVIEDAVVETEECSAVSYLLADDNSQLLDAFYDVETDEVVDIDGKIFYVINIATIDSSIDYAILVFFGMHDMSYDPAEPSDLRLLVNLIKATNFAMPFSPEFREALISFGLTRLDEGTERVFICADPKIYNACYTYIRQQLARHVEKCKSLAEYAEPKAQEQLQDAYTQLSKAIDKLEVHALHYLDLLHSLVTEQQLSRTAEMERIRAEEEAENTAQAAATPVFEKTVVSAGGKDYTSESVATHPSTQLTCAAAPAVNTRTLSSTGLFSTTANTNSAKQTQIALFAESISYNKSDRTITLTGVKQSSLNPDLASIITCFLFPDSDSDHVQRQFQQILNMFDSMVKLTQDGVEIIQEDLATIIATCPLTLSFTAGKGNYTISLYLNQKAISKQNGSVITVPVPYTSFYDLLREKLRNYYGKCLEDCRRHSPENLALLTQRYNNALAKIDGNEEVATQYVTLFKRLGTCSRFSAEGIHPLVGKGPEPTSEAKAGAGARSGV